MARNESCSAPDHDPTKLTLPPSCSNLNPLPLALGEPLSLGAPLALAPGDSLPALAGADSDGADAAGDADPPELPPPHAATISAPTATRAARRLTECRASSVIQV